MIMAVKVSELVEALGLKRVSGTGDREVTGCHIGDLLSMVMSHAQSGDAWITIQGNINVTAVASLTDTAMVIIAEGVTPDANTVKRAEDEDISIFTSEKTAFALALEIGKRL